MLSASVNKDDFSHCENVVSHVIEPSYGRNLKSTVFLFFFFKFIH